MEQSIASRVVAPASFAIYSQAATYPPREKEPLDSSNQGLDNSWICTQCL